MIFCTASLFTISGTLDGNTWHEAGQQVVDSRNPRRRETSVDGNVSS